MGGWAGRHLGKRQVIPVDVQVEHFVQPEQDLIPRPGGPQARSPLVEKRHRRLHVLVAVQLCRGEGVRQFFFEIMRDYAVIMRKKCRVKTEGKKLVWTKLLLLL